MGAVEPPHPQTDAVNTPAARTTALPPMQRPAAEHLTRKRRQSVAVTLHGAVEADELPALRESSRLFDENHPPIAEPGRIALDGETPKEPRC